MPWRFSRTASLSSQGGQLRSRLTRFNTDGSPDNTFGAGGVVTSPVASVTSESGVAVQPDGNIVVAGAAVDGTKGTNRSFAVLRYLGHATGPSFTITGPSSFTAGTAGTFTITVLNPDGSADTGYTGTVHFTSSDPQAVLPADFTVLNGVDTFTATLKTAGIQSLTATDTLTPGISGSEANIRVNPAAATHFSVSSPSSVAKGDGVQHHGHGPGRLRQRGHRLHGHRPLHELGQQRRAAGQLHLHGRRRRRAHLHQAEDEDEGLADDHRHRHGVWVDHRQLVDRRELGRWAHRPGGPPSRRAGPRFV